ncbi:hypothetical protein [Roseburia sp. 499]|uniref:hypothetical protein n=1 Tax=Roseburia sp. 499 TaxID=1261634 RepID=UPI000952CE01|nr:hypothetical protein [Roseburia sp. 499]WVK70177.1 hypothetical protein BIV20_01205 [Roseburia sp. 499]
MKEIRINTYKLKQDVAKMEGLQGALKTEQSELQLVGKGKTPEQVQAAEEKLNAICNSLEGLINQTMLALKGVEERVESADYEVARAFESTQ